MRLWIFFCDTPPVEEDSQQQEVGRLKMRRTMSTVVNEAFDDASAAIDEATRGISTIGFDEHQSAWVKCTDSKSGCPYWYNTTTGNRRGIRHPRRPPPPSATSTPTIASLSRMRGSSIPTMCQIHLTGTTSSQVKVPGINLKQSRRKRKRADQQPLLNPPALPERPQRVLKYRAASPLDFHRRLEHPRPPLLPRIKPLWYPCHLHTLSVTTIAPRLPTRPARAKSVRITSTTSEDGNAHKRRMSIEEIYATEHVYVDHLRIL